MVNIYNPISDAQRGINLATSLAQCIDRDLLRNAQNEKQVHNIDHLTLPNLTTYHNPQKTKI